MKFMYEAHNPWWQGKDFDAAIGRGRYLGNLTERLMRDQIEIFIGGRGRGKTTLLKQVVKHLLSTGKVTLMTHLAFAMALSCHP